MCGPHWHQVPREIQSEVYRLWRSWNRTHDDDVWGAYLTAREAALGAVEGTSRG
jgi:hypothetical protein